MLRWIPLLSGVWLPYPLHGWRSNAASPRKRAPLAPSTLTLSVTGGSLQKRCRNTGATDAVRPQSTSWASAILQPLNNSILWERLFHQLHE